MTGELACCGRSARRQAAGRSSHRWLNPTLTVPFVSGHPQWLRQVPDEGFRNVWLTSATTADCTCVTSPWPAGSG